MKQPSSVSSLLSPALWCVALVVGFTVAPSVGTAAGDGNTEVGRAVKMYCTNVRDKAVEARFAWQHKKLEELGAKLKQKIAELEARTKAYQKWYDLRNRFAKLATGKLVRVYSLMRPDAAAKQLEAMPETTAAAIVFKLETRQASTILNEMETRKAARLSMIIADSARKSSGGRS